MTSTNKNIIFIGGIHGVGKTFYSNNLSKCSNIPHYSCSELISRFKSIDNKTKLTKNINENQSLLKLAVDSYLSPNNKYILDGHFCLINDKGEICRVPEKIFLELNMSNIIVLENDCNKIIDNLKRRDNRVYSKSLISSFQNEEILYAKYIAQLLNISIEIINLSKSY